MFGAECEALFAISKVLSDEQSSDTIILLDEKSDWRLTLSIASAMYAS